VCVVCVCVFQIEKMRGELYAIRRGMVLFCVVDWIGKSVDYFDDDLLFLFDNHFASHDSKV